MEQARDEMLYAARAALPERGEFAKTASASQYRYSVPPLTQRSSCQWKRRWIWLHRRESSKVVKALSSVRASLLGSP